MPICKLLCKKSCPKVMHTLRMYNQRAVSFFRPQKISFFSYIAYLNGAEQLVLVNEPKVFILAFKGIELLARKPRPGLIGDEKLSKLSGDVAWLDQCFFASFVLTIWACRCWKSSFLLFFLSPEFLPVFSIKRMLNMQARFNFQEARGTVGSDCRLEKWKWEVNALRGF